MPEMLYLSEYREGNRAAQVLKNTTTKQFVVYCFCCGNESESEPFELESDAEDWAENFVQKQIDLPHKEGEEQTEHRDCGCNG